MSERPTANIMERIRKILSKTQDNGCTQAEADAAFAMASRLLAEHNLTMDDVEATGGEAAESWMEEECHETGRWTLEDNLCYGILKNYFFVEGFFNHRDGHKVFILFGKAENVQVGRFIWTALHASFDRMWTMYRYLNKRPASERRLFIAGMAKGYAEKLRDERAAMEIERDLTSGKSGGTALALVSIHDKTLEKYREAHPRHKASKGRYYAEAVGDRSTLAAGYEAGKKLNLNRGIGGNRQKGIGSE